MIQTSSRTLRVLYYAIVRSESAFKVLHGAGLAVDCFLSLRYPDLYVRIFVFSLLASDLILQLDSHEEDTCETKLVPLKNHEYREGLTYRHRCRDVRGL